MTTGVQELFRNGTQPVTASGSSSEVSTALVSTGVLRLAVTAFTAGTAPTVSWSLKGYVGGEWVQIYALATQNVANGTTVVNLSPAATPGIVMPERVRLDWTLNGAPTDATLSYALIGRN